MTNPLPGQLSFWEAPRRGRTGEDLRRELMAFDPRGGAADRDEGIARAEAGAPAVALADADEAVRTVARLQPFFTTDDVWAQLAAMGAPSFPEPRAMGAVFVRAEAAGVIAPTDDYEPSKRRACHRRPLRVWRSLVYGEAAA